MTQQEMFERLVSRFQESVQSPPLTEEGVFEGGKTLAGLARLVDADESEQLEGLIVAVASALMAGLMFSEAIRRLGEDVAELKGDGEEPLTIPEDWPGLYL